MELLPGIYEEIISEYLASRLAGPETEGRIFKGPLRRFDPQITLARYVSRILRKSPSVCR